MIGALVVGLKILVVVLSVLILGRALVSWVDPRGQTPIGRLLFVTTEPILGPIRQVLPRTGRVDLAPLVALVPLTFVLSRIV